MSRSAVICAWAAALLAASVHAQLAPPLTGPAQSSRELAAQALPPGGMFAYKARLIELVKLKRHDVLHQHFEERLRDIKREGASDQGGRYMFTMVGGVDEANARVFDEWADAHPQSYIGPLARASFNFHRGWEARGNKMARETSASQFAELDRWLMLVRRDVQLALQREPGCALCYSVLIELSMPLSLHKETQEWFTLGIGIDRDSIAVPLAYYHALDRRWGGSVDQQSIYR